MGGVKDPMSCLEAGLTLGYSRHVSEAILVPNQPTCALYFVGSGVVLLTE